MELQEKEVQEEILAHAKALRGRCLARWTRQIHLGHGRVNKENTGDELRKVKGNQIMQRHRLGLTFGSKESN